MLLIFSELLGLEITKSNDVQIQQIILIECYQTYFFHGHIISIYITNLEIKVINKVKESYLEIVKGELKQ